MTAKVMCKTIYGHDYLLEPDDSAAYSNLDSTEPPANKRPRSAEDYKAYKYVIPSAKVVNDFKHKKAISQEVTAANAIKNKPDNVKLTLHYDSTMRSRIDGEWPSIILNFKGDDKRDCQMIPLRPLFFAFEDREQISELIVETLKRLSAALSNSQTICQLWEKVYALMSDAVTKNMNVQTLVAEKLGSSHIPHHFLCKSYTCERMESDNLS